MTLVACLRATAASAVLVTTAATAQTATAEPPTAAAAELPPLVSAAQRYKTELVCRTSLETGSLVTKRRTCLTRKQWDYVDQEHRDEARKMMMENMGHPPG